MRMGLVLGNVGFLGQISKSSVRASAAVQYISPYSTTNLFHYSDVNFGASGITLNSSNQVASWKNQVAGGINLTPTSTLPAYLANVDGFPAINVAGGDLEAIQSMTRNQPLSVTVLLKIVINPGSYSYNSIFAAANMTMIQKFTTGLLIQSLGVNSTGPDMPANVWVPVTMVWNTNSSFAVVGTATTGIFTVADNSFTKLVLGGEMLFRLLLCYNRGLSLADVTTLHNQIRAAYNLP